MTLETTVNDLTLAVTTLTTSVQGKRTVLDAAAQAAAASLTTTQGLQTQAAASAATAAAKATEATNNATQVAAYKTAAAALDTTTTATAAVTNLLPDMLAKKDPARHPFRKKMPTLVLDFERQKCHRYSPSTGFGETPLLPFMTFARNSSATYTGPDGLIKTAAANEPRFDYDPLTGECKGLLVEEQRTNLITYSKLSAGTSGWTYNNAVVRSNSGIAPDGTMSAALVKNTPGVNSSFSQGGSALATNVVYTRSAYVKPDGSGNSIFVFEGIGGPSGAGGSLIFNCVTKVFSGSTSDANSYGYKEVGNGWLFVWVVGEKSATRIMGTSHYIGQYGATGQQHGVYVWGIQLEAGAFPTSYIPTPAVFSARASTATYLDANGVVQTAASGVARSNAYDYDSDGVLRPIGLLLEASATNQLLWSKQFDNAVWQKTMSGVASAPVVTANYGAAPDGTNTADRLVLALNAGATIDDHALLYQPQTTVVGTTYTQSVWLKTTDASTKTALLSFSGETPKLVTVTGTWQRFSNTGTASDTARGFRLALRGTAGTSDSADLLVWGAQQGVGSYPTSYISTTSAQVTRAADTSTSAQATRVADDAKVDGTKFSDFYNPSQGTLVATARIGDSTSLLDSAGVRRGLAAVRGASANDIVRLCSAGRDFVVTSGGVNLMDVSIGTLSPNSVTRAAIRLKGSNFIGTRDGSLGSAANSGVTPNVSMLFLGKSDGVNGLLNGHVSRISYYPQPFTNEELQAATSA